MAKCSCFEAMRELSRNGFLIEVRSRRDRLGSADTRLDCARCATVYVLTEAPVALYRAAS
jgi:hypothetical protein